MDEVLWPMKFGDSHLAFDRSIDTIESRPALSVAATTAVEVATRKLNSTNIPPPFSRSRVYAAAA